MRPGSHPALALLTGFGNHDLRQPEPPLQPAPLQRRLLHRLEIVLCTVKAYNVTDIRDGAVFGGVWKVDCDSTDQVVRNDVAVKSVEDRAEQDCAGDFGVVDQCEIVVRVHGFTSRHRTRRHGSGSPSRSAVDRQKE